jgi:hypothetical protein
MCRWQDKEECLGWTFDYDTSAAESKNDKAEVAAAVGSAGATVLGLKPGTFATDKKGLEWMRETINYLSELQGNAIRSNSPYVIY